MTHLEFGMTNWMRLLAIVCLAIGDLWILNDRFILAFVLFTLAGLLYYMQKHLYEILHHNHHAQLQREKEHARQLQEEALAELRTKRSQAST